MRINWTKWDKVARNLLIWVCTPINIFVFVSSLYEVLTVGGFHRPSFMIAWSFALLVLTMLGFKFLEGEELRRDLRKQIKEMGD